MCEVITGSVRQVTPWSKSLRPPWRALEVVDVIDRARTHGARRRARGLRLRRSRSPHRPLAPGPGVCLPTRHVRRSAPILTSAIIEQGRGQALETLDFIAVLERPLGRQTATRRLRA